MPLESVALLVVLVVAAAVVGWAWSRRDRRGGKVAAPGADEASPEATPGHDLRFTVFRPGAAVPDRWYDVLVFMHEFVHPSRRLATELAPEERIRREVRRILGDDAPAYVPATEDAAVAVPRAGELTFVVDLPGFQVNPPRQTVAWREDLQHVRFRVLAGAALAGATGRGRVTVFHGPLLLAEMALVIPVGDVEEASVTEPMGTYRKIFASYAREDDAIVRQVAALSASLGDRWLQDVTELRAGEAWNPALARLIEEADVFQLFWSWKAMESEWVRREWTHALGLGRPGFVRPVYWEEPLPCRPEAGLPPPELESLHFHRLPMTVPVTVPAAAPGAASPRTPAPTPPTLSTPAPAPPRSGTPPPSSSRRPPIRPSSRPRLAWALPGVAVLLLAVGTSTLMTRAGIRPPEAGAPGPSPAAPPGAATPGEEAGEGPDEVDEPADGGPPVIGTPIPATRPEPPVAARPDPGTPRTRPAQPAPAPARLTVRVTRGGVPFPGALVRVHTGGGQVMRGETGADGTVLFTGVAPGTATLELSLPDGVSAATPLPRPTLVAGEAARVEVRVGGEEPAGGSGSP